ncbi:MAG: 2Fe-2S iron-sulfur cluster binding domain-containing protein [Anaerolineales bacterium]|nr:MAG: 2Fe-2S iron-sulfur cluster binding domain-containing protein [Anaerolineales bacterium]
MLNFWLNGSEVKLDNHPGELLSDMLRYRLGLTGTKIGCGEAECGACTVLLDGDPVLACIYPAARVQDRQVITIEGLSENGALHPLQQAFIETGAVQCGFCIPGQILTSYALLQRIPDPSEAEIRAALKDTLCRCAGYPTIIRAVQIASHRLRNGSKSENPVSQSSVGVGFIGRHVPRPDSMTMVTGQALFTDDYTFPGMLVGKVLRAGVPHAILEHLSVERAREVPGVVALLTAADIPGENLHGIVYRDWPVMVGVGEKVRYVGDAIAIVAAEHEQAAAEACARIETIYRELAVVSDPVMARQSEAGQIHAGGNLLKHIKVRKGDLKAGWEQADFTQEGTYYTAATDHAFLEPECSIAVPGTDGRLEIYVGSQIPYADREQVARALGIPQDQVRIIGTLIGGGFGGKEDIAGQIHAALLAQASGRPVKILFDRHESLLVHPKRHATQIRVRFGAMKEGGLVAAETELHGDTGAYASLGDKVMTRATTHSAGPYNIDHVRADCYAMYTNNPPAGAFRGFGVSQACFAVESCIDDLADQLGIEPFTFRRMNALQVGHTTNTGQVLKESVGLLECLDRVEAELGKRVRDRDPFIAITPPGKPHLRRAWGIAAAYKNTGLGGGAPDKAAAEVELFSDGTLEVRCAAPDMGQGLVTVLQLIAAEELGLALEKVSVRLSDTDLTPDGGPTTASRQTFVTGNAARHAAMVLREALRSSVAEKLDVPPAEVNFSEGLAQVNGHEVTLGQAAEWMKAEGRDPRAQYEYWAPETQPLGSGGDMHFAYSFAVQAVEVEVDLQTGVVEVIQVIAANDVGKAINPLGLQGQVEGGVMMGLGNALTEEFITEAGIVFSDRLARYRMPSITQAPRITSIVVEHPTSEGPYGAKGVGEISSIPTTPAITNAIKNACDVRIQRLPVDQDALARAIAAGEFTCG